jgi:hypothetical protein
VERHLKSERGRSFNGVVCPIVSLLLVSCSHQPAIKQQQSSTPIPAMILDETLAELGWDKIEKLKPKFVVFGEIHGTTESAQFFGRVASALALDGKRVLVAVELSALDNANVQAAWNGPHAQFEEKLTSRGWSGRRDGVGSVAMLEMLSKLHTLKESGAKLSLVAFNGFSDDTQRLRLDTPGSQAGHEAGQAENIKNAAQRDKFDYTLVLVGKLHARKKDVVDVGPEFQPMATHLQKAGKLVSLAMLSADGTAWNCTLKEDIELGPDQKISTDMLDCGNHSLSGKAGLHAKQTMIVGWPAGEANAGGYDGYYWLGAVSGSPPARP